MRQQRNLLLSKHQQHMSSGPPTNKIGYHRIPPIHRKWANKNGEVGFLPPTNSPNEQGMLDLAKIPEALKAHYLNQEDVATFFREKKLLEHKPQGLPGAPFYQDGYLLIPYYELSVREILELAAKKRINVELDCVGDELLQLTTKRGWSLVSTMPIQCDKIRKKNGFKQLGLADALFIFLYRVHLGIDPFDIRATEQILVETSNGHHASIYFRDGVLGIQGKDYFAFTGIQQIVENQASVLSDRVGLETAA